MYWRSASFSIQALGSAATLAAMAYAGAGFHLLLNGFTAWTLAPYVTLLTAATIACTRGSLIAVFGASLAAALFGSFIYYDALCIHTSSTSALVFIFIPLYQLLAAVIVLVFCIERRAQAVRRRDLTREIFL